MGRDIPPLIQCTDITVHCGCPTQSYHFLTKAIPIPRFTAGKVTLTGKMEHQIVTEVLCQEDNPKFVPKIWNFKELTNTYPELYKLHGSKFAFEMLGREGIDAIRFPNIVDSENGYSGYPNLLCKGINGFVPVAAIYSKKQNIQEIAAFYSMMIRNLGYQSNEAYAVQDFLGQRKSLIKDFGLLESNVIARIVEMRNMIENDFYVEPALILRCIRCPLRGLECFTGAKDDFDLTLLPGIGRKAQLRLMTLGINNIEELCNANINEIVENQKLPLAKADALYRRLSNYQVHAFAYRENNIIQHSEIKRPTTEIELYIDVESDSIENNSKWEPSIYHHGCYIFDKKTQKGRYVYVLAKSNSEEDRKAAFFEFWEMLRDSPEINGRWDKCSFIQYSRHDAWASESCAKRYFADDRGRLKEIFGEIANVSYFPFVNGSKFVYDLHRMIKKAVISPWGYTLKVLSKYLLSETWQCVFDKELRDMDHRRARTAHNMIVSLIQMGQGRSSYEEYENFLVSYNRTDCERTKDLMHLLNEMEHPLLKRSYEKVNSAAA